MNPYEAYGSPPNERSPRYRAREDDSFERTDSYRRRSPGMFGPALQYVLLLTILVNDRRRPPPRNRSRSPAAIDRYQPERERPARDDFYEPQRTNTRERDDRRRAPSPTAANI